VFLEKNQVRLVEINYLKEFVIIAQTGNFLEAAEILYSSQSTLSKHIQSMEEELGIPLFDRTTRKVRITKYGQLLLPYARQITEIQGRCVASMKSNLETDRETLKLGSIYGLPQYKITDVLVNFKRSRPESIFNVMQGSSRSLTEMLREGKCELAFIRDVVDENDEFVKLPFATDTLVAVLPVTHPLAMQEIIPLRMLEEENFLLEEPQTMPYRLSVKACQLSGFEPKVYFTDRERENLIDLISKGMGVSLMMKKIVMNISNPKIAFVDVTPNVTTQISLCYMKGEKLSPAARYFLSCAGFEENL
jgi:LysR family transcriptional regulator, transcription activator of glutamate synthase operon